MTYKVLSSLTANSINSADLLKVKTDLLIIAVNKKTSAAAELKGLQSITQSLVQESIKEINSGSRKSIFLPAPAKVAAKNCVYVFDDVVSQQRVDLIFEYIKPKKHFMTRSVFSNPKKRCKLLVVET